VFDHFQALVAALGSKLAPGTARSAPNDQVGGATLSFELPADHPHRDEVLSLLKTVRSQLNELWTRVGDENVKRAASTGNNPAGPPSGELVSFYFGQSVQERSRK
jgi:hypothetical protein